MNALRRARERLRPRTLRARIALTISVALAVALIGIQGALSLVLDRQVRDSIEANLRTQAQAVAFAVSRGGPTAAAESSRILAGTRMIVRIKGEVVYFTAPVRSLDVRATVVRGDVEVTLERAEPRSLLAVWVLPGLLAIGLVATGAVIWFLAGGLARRLRRSITDLTCSTEALEAGDLTVRAAESDGELGRLARAFNDMAARLEAADLRQRTFLADVAHELRTPVTAIEGFSGALGDGTASTPADRAEAAEFIRDEAARLRSLIRDLQQLTWLDLDPPLSPRQVDLSELARTAAARFGADAAARGVALGAPEEPIEARTDPAHVETILANLVDNALRHTPEGGSVRIDCQRDGPDAVIVVSDTGKGVPPEHLPYLFDRLYRVESSRDRVAGGSGLGLSIVRRLATLLGGRVSVQSRLGEGTAFTVRLPARVPEPAPAAAPQGATSRRR